MYINSSMNNMIKTTCSLLLLLSCLILSASSADDTNFTGTWTIDIRSKSQHDDDCGFASFTLLQNRDRICGDHVFYTPGCGRLNEGFPGSVKGVVVGSTAILVITSGRNGAIVMGTATKKGNTIQWTTLEDIKPGEPEGDSPLILGNGILKLDNPKSANQELIDACKNK